MSLRTAIAAFAAATALTLVTPTFAQNGGGLEADLDGPNGQGTGQGQQANVESTQYEDWTLQCREGQSQGGNLCRMVQSVDAESGDRQLMQVIVAQMPEQNATMVQFLVPLGVFLQETPAVKVDGNEIGRAGYIICVQQGCLARMQTNGEALAAMRQGRNLQITVTDRRGQSREIAASLLGFTDAFNGLGS